MLISEIIALAEAQCDESYSVEEWLSLLNICLDDLSPTAKNLVSVANKSVTVTSGASSLVMSMDADLSQTQEIREVYYKPAAGKKTRLRKLYQGDIYSKGWKPESDKIILQGLGTEATGTVDLVLYKKIPHVIYDGVRETYTPTSPPPPLREQYHPMIVSWLCAKSQQREEEAEDKQDFFAEYMMAKQVFSEDRMKEMEPGQHYLLYRRSSTQAQNQQ